MPKIGMAGSSVMLLGFLEAMKISVDSGFDAFEVFAEFPQCVAAEVSPDERKKGRAIVDDSGIGLAVHAPFNSLNIAAINPGVRKESLQQTIDAIDLCADLGGSAVVVHNGEYVISEAMRRKLPQAGKMQWDHNIEALRKAALRAGERGVTLCLENIGFEPEHMDRNVDDLIGIREEVGVESLMFCLDIGHARLNNELDHAVKTIGPMTRHIHFTDNFGEKDDHLPIGEGNFDYGPHLDFFKSFEGIITLEVINVGDDPEDAQKSLAHVRSLFG